MRLLEEAGLPRRRDQPRLRPTAPRSATPALAEPRPRGRPLHRLDRRLPGACGGRSASNIERYRNYPRIVGETGGKDFIVAHPSADVDASATGDRARRVRVPGPEVLGRLARSTSPSNLWPALRERLAAEVGDDHAWATSPTSRTSWAPSSTGAPSTTQSRGDRGGARRSPRSEIVAGGGCDDARAGSSSRR